MDLIDFSDRKAGSLMNMETKQTSSHHNMIFRSVLTKIFQGSQSKRIFLDLIQDDQCFLFFNSNIRNGGKGTNQTSYIKIIENIFYQRIVVAIDVSKRFIFPASKLL